jgi:holo-[acyl-carrier protein] synthase
MIYGVGIDIVLVNRIRKMIEKFGEKFLTRIFTDGEIAYSDGHEKSRFQHYAARWAAKEAVFKALKGDWKTGIIWKEIEVKNEPRGNPVIILHGAAQNVSNSLRITRLEVSISHTTESASAVVVAEKN